MNLFIYYPKCSTCQKAKKWLDENGIKYTERHIVEDRPNFDEIKKWASDIDIKKLFNTSGIKYRALELTKKLPEMSENEKIETLASDGMLVKRPLFVSDDFILVGFIEKAWEEKLK